MWRSAPLPCPLLPGKTWVSLQRVGVEFAGLNNFHILSSCFVNGGCLHVFYRSGQWNWVPCQHRLGQVHVRGPILLQRGAGRHWQTRSSGLLLVQGSGKLFLWTKRSKIRASGLFNFSKNGTTGRIKVARVTNSWVSKEEEQKNGRETSRENSRVN